MEFGLLSEAEARSPALSLSDAGTPHPPLPEHGCKGQEHSGERAPFWGWRRKQFSLDGRVGSRVAIWVEASQGLRNSLRSQSQENPHGP